MTLPKFMYLEDLFVWPEERGKGYGKALLLHLVKIDSETLQLSASFQRLTDKGLKENEHEAIRKHHLVDLWRTAYCH